MPFLIQCSSCGTSEDLRDDKIAVPYEWSAITVKVYSKSQVNDTVKIGHLCPQCTPHAYERAVTPP